MNYDNDPRGWLETCQECRHGSDIKLLAGDMYSVCCAASGNEERLRRGGYYRSCREFVEGPSLLELITAAREA